MRQQRVEQLRKIMREKNLDGFLISNFYNILYLVGFKTLTPDERESWCFITDKNIYIFTDSRYLNNKLSAFVEPSEKGQISNNKFLILKLITPEMGLIKHLQEIIAKEKTKRFAFEGDDLKVNELEKLKEYLTSVELVSLEKAVIKIRSVKDKDEIDRLRHACRISDLCLQNVIKIIKPGISEKEIAFKMELWLKERGFDIAFYPIVAIDKNSAVPHYDTVNGNNETVKKNSIILIDYGAKFSDYHSDITRMIFTGRPTEKMVKYYYALLNSEEKTIIKMATDNNPVSIDQFCRQQLGDFQSILGDNQPSSYPHSTGHGVGLHIHENPKISFTSTDVLLVNQVVTIEPGIYLKNKWGMRIEDTILIKEKEVEVLTKFNKKLLII